MKLQVMEGTDRSRAQLGYEIVKLQEENAQLRAITEESVCMKNLKRQLNDFTVSTQLNLEKTVLKAESRAIMAEEQLASLQKYISKATVAYQKEIIRLRAPVAK